jgi:hypothetical protein
MRTLTEKDIRFTMIKRRTQQTGLDLGIGLLCIMIMYIEPGAVKGARCSNQWAIYACVGGNRRSMPVEAHQELRPSITLRDLFLRSVSNITVPADFLEEDMDLPIFSKVESEFIDHPLKSFTHNNKNSVTVRIKPSMFKSLLSARYKKRVSSSREKKTHVSDVIEAPALEREIVRDNGQNDDSSTQNTYRLHGNGNQGEHDTKMELLIEKLFV